MACNRYAELPEDLVQHIQSFLDPKEAVRTSVLSKLWYSAWSTCPILCLDDSNIPRTDNFTEFQNFTSRRINRYQKLNLKVDSFKLSMSTRHDDYDDEFTKLVNELILSALTLGVNDLYVDIDFARYTLPDQVFSSICLKKLYMQRGIINLPQSNGKSGVLCSRLVSLELWFVRVSDDMMTAILLGCPLMEDLRIIRCYDFKTINLSIIHLSLKTLEVDGPNNLLVEWEENCTPESRVSMQHQYHNLISLKLRNLKVDDVFLKFFEHGFPRIERLELQLCRGPDNIDIGSNSLRHLSLLSIDGLRVINVQVPNIQNFTLKTTQTECIHSISFLIASAEWKSVLKFHKLPRTYSRVRNVCWLSKIGDILTRSSLSKVSIVLDLTMGHLGSISAGDIPSRPTSPFVENLEIQTLDRMSLYYGTLFGWLLCCRPKYITWINASRGKTSHKPIELVYKELNKNENRIVTYALPCIHGLEEVDIEYYEETLREWRTVSQESKEPAHEGGKFEEALKVKEWRRVSQGAKDAAHGEVKFRLRLKWTL